MADFFHWVAEHLGLSLGLAAAWVGMLVVSLVAGHYFLVHMPADYFQRQHVPLENWRQSRPVLRWMLLIVKNLVGVLLIVAGLLMLIGPGQGILALLLGFSLLDIPGKQAVEKWIMQKPGVLSIVNRIRAKAQRPPLVMAK